MTKSLILNADDLGISLPTNLAIAHVVNHGVLSSASLMVTLEAAADAVRRVLLPNPTLGVGLHLCLTSGRPVLPAEAVPLLVGPHGTFRHGFLGLWRLVRSSQRTAALEQIGREFAAQIAWAESQGLVLDHLDSHQHIHMIPEIFALVASLAAERGVALRMSDERFQANGALSFGRLRRGGVFKKLLLSHWARRLRGQGGLPLLPEHYYGILDSGQMTLGRLLRIVRHLPEGTSEINIHPGWRAELDADWAGSPADRRFLQRPERGQELQALLAPALREALHAEKIELVRFQGLLARCASPPAARAA